MRAIFRACIETKRLEIAIYLEAKPDEAPDAAETDFFRTEPRRVAGGDAGHFVEVAHRAEFHFARTSRLAHGFELAGNALTSGNAGLGAALENSFDGVERGVVDPFAEGQVESVGRGHIVERKHLKGFENGKRNTSRRLNGGEIERRGDWASPLQSQSGGDFLFAGETEFFDPLADFSITRATLGFEGGLHFEISKLAASDHQKAQGNAVRGLWRGRHGAQARELAEESGLEALGLAIEGALEEGSGGTVTSAEALPERLRAGARGERTSRLRGRGVAAFDPVGGPG